jgi:hypothetical protein
MKDRRGFLKIAAAAAIPAAAMFVASGAARADEGDAKEFLGSWNTKHDLPLPPGFFHEFLSFAEGGVLHETNSFLHPTSKVNLSSLGLTAPMWSMLSASDGVGSWKRIGNGVANLVFRKMLFDGNTGAHFGDLLVSGTYSSDGRTLSGTAHIRVVAPFDDPTVLADFGFAGSRGIRIA